MYRFVLRYTKARVFPTAYNSEACFAVMISRRKDLRTVKMHNNKLLCYSTMT